MRYLLRLLRFVCPSRLRVTIYVRCLLRRPPCVLRCLLRCLLRSAHPSLDSHRGELA